MELIKLTQKIVSIPSYLDDTTNEKLLGNFIYSYIQKNIPELQVYKQYDKKKERFNVIAKNSDNPRVVFSCHMDTVQPVGSIKDQLDSRVEGDKLFGLGASDMKGGLAAAIIAIQELRDNLPPLAIVFDYDEEYYFEGIINFLKKYTYRPKLALFTEPTNMTILNGCRGITEVRFDVIGKTGHGSRPDEAINAIQTGCKIVKELQSFLSAQDTKDIGANTINFSSLIGGREQEGKIVEQANAVPDIARILLDIRISNPEVDPTYVLKKLNELAAKYNVRINKFKTNLYIKPVFTRPDDLKVVSAATKKVIGKFKFNRELDKTGLFEGAYVKPAWDCPCCAFGPGPRNTEFTAGEYVSIKDLIQTKNVYKEIIKLII